MLKAIQILGCSSGFVSHRWKPNTSSGLPFITVSAKPLSSSLRRLPSNSSLLAMSSTSPSSCFGAFRPRAAHSESNPVAASSSSSSSVAVKSAVSFSECPFLKKNFWVFGVFCFQVKFINFS